MSRLRQHLLTACTILCATAAMAEEAHNMRDLFREMPDSLLPYLTHNNRLDLMDFIDSKMKAEVKNAFDGTTEMTCLSDDSLTIRLNEASAVDMRLMQLDGTEADSCRHVICVVWSWRLGDGGYESCTQFYRTDWQLVDTPQNLNAEDQRRVMSWNKSTILKTIRKNLNKP